MHPSQTVIIKKFWNTVVGGEPNKNGNSGFISPRETEEVFENVWEKERSRKGIRKSYKDKNANY